MAVPHILRAEHRVARELRGAGATSPESARPVTLTRPIYGRAIDRLLSEGALREAGPGRYWLDVEAYAAYRRGLRTRALTALALGLVVILVLALAGLLR